VGRDALFFPQVEVPREEVVGDPGDRKADEDREVRALERIGDRPPCTAPC
jgi:hypothetical protein